MRMGMLFGANKNLPLKLMNTSGQLETVFGGGGNSYITEKNPAYTAFTFRPSNIGTSYGTGTTSYVYLGSGVGAVTADDYCLESLLTGGYKASITPNEDCVDSSGYCFGEVIINVIATKSIVIGELGYSYKNYLLDRTVLDTPISLSNGQAATIKYRITNASSFNV